MVKELVLTEDEQEYFSQMQVAGKLRDKADWPEATKHYVRLYQNTPAKCPTLFGGRRSLLSDMSIVLSHYPEARPEFEKLRDVALEEAKQNKYRDDWVGLNTLLGWETEKDTISWFDSCKHEACPTDFLLTEGLRLENILISHERWADLVFIYREPIKKIDEIYKDAQEDIRNQGCRPGEIPFDIFPAQAKVVYIAYLAAGAWETATQIAKRVLELQSNLAVRQALMRAVLNQRCPLQELSLSSELPAVADPNLHQGCAELDSGNFEAALKAFELAVQSSGGKSAISIAHRGAAQLLCRHFEEGIRDLTKAIELTGYSAFAYRWRGWGFALRFQFALALQDYSKAIGLNQKDAFAYCGRGKALFHLQKLSAAIQDCDESIRCNQTNSEAYFTRAICYEATANYGQAKLDLDQFQKLKSANQSLLDERDSACLRDSCNDGRNRLIDDIARFDLYIRVESPGLDDHYTKRAQAKVMQGDIDAALKDFEAAEAITPNKPEILLQKVSALLRIDRVSEAFAAANKFIEACPQQAAGYLARADALSRANDYDLAVKDLNKANTLGGDLVARAYFNRARVCEKRGQAEAAQEDAQYAAFLGYSGEWCGPAIPGERATEM